MMVDNGEVPITFVIRRLVKRNFIDQYEQWLRTASERVHKFEGNLGLYVIRPMHSHHPEYVLIIEFDSEDNLSKFKNSSLRKKWLKELSKFSIGVVSEKSLSAIDSWFTLNSKGYSDENPIRYKTVILTMLAAAPTVVIINFLFKSLKISFGYFPELIITLTLTILILSYLIIPGLTKLLKTWIYV